MENTEGGYFRNLEEARPLKRNDSQPIFSEFRPGPRTRPKACPYTQEAHNNVIWLLSNFTVATTFSINTVQRAGRKELYSYTDNKFDQEEKDKNLVKRFGFWSHVRPVIRLCAALFAWQFFPRFPTDFSLSNTRRPQPASVYECGPSRDRAQCVVVHSA